MVRMLTMAAVAAVLVAACADGGGDGDDRSLVVEFTQEAAAEEGVDLSDDEAECMIDVMTEYVSLGEMADLARAGETLEDAGALSVEEENEVALALFDECPDVFRKAMQTGAGG